MPAAEDAELTAAADEVRACGARAEAVHTDLAAKNRLQAAASRVLPDAAEAKQQSRMMQPGSADA